MGCPGVEAGVDFSAAPTSAGLFEGQLGAGGSLVGALVLLSPPSHSQVRVVASEFAPGLVFCGLPGFLD